MSDAIWSNVPPTEAGWYYRTRSSVHPDEWVVTWEEGNRTTPLVGIKWARVPDAEMLRAHRSLRNNVAGCWRSFEHELRESMGNTNYQVIADLLAKLEGRDE